jgi:hypothetical protein
MTAKEALKKLKSVMATHIAEAEKLTAATLPSWVRDIDNHVLSCSVASLAAKSPAGRMPERLRR